MNMLCRPNKKTEKIEEDTQQNHKNTHKTGISGNQDN